MTARITTEELHRLAAGSPPSNGMDCAEVISDLARRVIAAEKIAEALILVNTSGSHQHARVIAKDALAEYEATK